jgi:acyl-CoA thioesterase-1
LSSVRAPANLGLAYVKELNRLYSELASQYDVPLYPFLLEDLYGKSSLMLSDGIHPNEGGVATIVKELGPFLLNYVE